ncbi:MAG: hypothetical protein ACI8RZ_002647 [Myxococcota bacterium]|jgi:hypothetical protein
MRLLILLLAVLVSPALANPTEPAEPTAGDEDDQDPAEPTPAAPELPHIPTPTEKLEEAVLNYQTSRHGLAMQQLALLSIDPEIESSVRQDARVYLGELLYIQGDTEGAKQLFEQVLTEDPSYEIDRFRHPPDVCGHFEYVRTYIVPEVEPTNPIMVLRSMPAAGYAPFAAYQFKYRTPRRWPLLVGQLSTGVASLVLYSVIWADPSYLETDPDTLQRLQALRVASFATTAGFYGLWGLGSLDARQHWRVNMAVQPAGDEVTFIGGATFRR